MPGSATWPVTINGNTYQQADFDGFAYVQNFPAIISDINVVALQAASDRAAIQAALAQNGNLLIPQTQCRLIMISSTQVRLTYLLGNFLWINGLNRPIPLSGVNLSNAGLTASTLYYIYAYMNGATMVLEASTTSYGVDSYGIRVKNGDVTRTLVGMVYVNASGQFQNTSSSRFVRSFYNRETVTLNSIYGSGSTTSTTSVEPNTALRGSFVCFNDDLVDFAFIGNVSPSGGSVYTLVSIDGNDTGSVQFTNATVNVPVSPRATQNPSDGLHNFNWKGYVTGGTSTWSGQCIGSLSA